MIYMKEEIEYPATRTKKSFLFGWRANKTNAFPYLETKRLILRRPTYADISAIFNYFSQDIVTEHYDLNTFQSEEEAEDLIRVWNVGYEMKRSIRWAICLKKTNELIGTCGFHNFREQHYSTELGYDLNPKFWRQGYMTEAINAIQHYGFKRLHLHRLEAFIFPQNLSSRKLLYRVGLRSEGILRDYFWEKNRFWDGEIFSILVDDWKKFRKHKGELRDLLPN